MIKKTYKAFDENGNLKAEGKTQAELANKLGVKSLTVLSGCVNTGVKFKKPFTSELYTITLEVEEILPKKEPSDSIQLKYRCEIKDLPNEIWKEIPDNKNNFASNKSRVKFVDKYGNTRLNATHISVNKTGLRYMSVSLYNPDTTRQESVFPLGRVIAKTFIDQSLSLYNGNKTAKVYYNDRNTLNNNLDNLQLITHQEVLQNIIKSGVNVGAVKRACYAEKDGIIRVYFSISELMYDITGKKTKSNSGRFNASVKNGYKICGYNVGYC